MGIEDARDAAPPPDETPSDSEPGLPRLFRVAPEISCGGQPADAAAFARLAELGVKTVVSVDGATPNVEAARQAGLRYVHIPIGYDGVPASAGEALARLVRDAEGPFYLHCHHGKHRAPAAAAVAAIAAGKADAERARQILTIAGTSKNYSGLWRDVAHYRPPSAGTKLPELVPVAKVSSLAVAMAGVDRAVDNLELCRAEAWRTPKKYPDLGPRREALLLREAFHESLRALDDSAEDRLRGWLHEAEQVGKALEEALQKDHAEVASKLFAKVRKRCRRCHRAYRD